MAAATEAHRFSFTTPEIVPTFLFLCIEQFQSLSLLS